MTTTRDLLAGSKPAIVSKPWKTLSPVLSFKVAFGWLHLSKLLSKKNYKFKTNSKNTNTNCELSANLFFPSLSRSREKELRQKGTEVNLRVRDIIWVEASNSFVAPGWEEKKAWERHRLSSMPRFPALASLRLISRLRRRLRELNSFIRTTRLKIYHSPSR